MIIFSSFDPLKVSIGSRAPHCRTVIQNGLNKTPETYLKNWSIMEHSPGLRQDTKSLKSCSRNRAKMLSKVSLEPNVTPNITRSSDSFSTVPPIVIWGWQRMHFAWLGDYHSLGLTRIQFHSPKVTPFTNPAKVTDQGLLL